MADTDLTLTFSGKNKDVSKSIDAILKKLDNMEKGIKDTAKESKKFGDQMSKSFTNLAKKAIKFTVAFLAIRKGFQAFGSGIKQFANFEKKLGEVSTLLGKEGPKQIQQYEKALRGMATRTSASVDELTSGLYQVISAGVSGSESVAGAMNLLEVAQKTSVAGVTNVLVAVDALTTTLNAYNKTTEDAAMFSDIMFQTVKLGKINFEQLSYGIGQVASIASGANISFEEMNAAIATLTKQGIQPVRAFTTLRSSIVSLMKSNKELTGVFGEHVGEVMKRDGLMGVMKKLNEVTQGDTVALSKLKIETEALAGISILAGSGMDSFAESLGEYGNAIGAVDGAAEKMSKTFEEQKKRFWNVFNEILMKLGEAILPTLMGLMKDFSNWVSENSDEITTFFRELEHIIKAMVEMMKVLLDLLADVVEAVSTTNKVFDDMNRIAEDGENRIAELVKAGMNPWEATAKVTKEVNEEVEAYMIKMEKLAKGPTVATFGPTTTMGPAGGQRQVWAGMAGMGGMMAGGLQPGGPGGGVVGGVGKPGGKPGGGMTDAQKKAWERDVKRSEGFRHKLRIANATALERLRLQYEKDLENVAKMRFKRAEDRVETLYLLEQKYIQELADERKKLSDNMIKAAQAAAKMAKEKMKFDEKQRKTIQDSIEAYRTMREEWSTMAAGKWAGPSMLEKMAEEIGIGFLRKVGEGFLGVVTQASEFLFAPFNQIVSLLGMALSGEGIPKLQESLDGFVNFVTDLANNLDTILSWIAEKAVPEIIRVFVENMPVIIHALASGAFQIVAAIIELLPEIIDAFVNLIPNIVTAFIENIPQIALAIGKAIAKAFIRIVSGDWSGETSWLKGQEGLLPNEIPILGKLHEGGMVNGTLERFTNAIRAHSGMFVKPSLAHDEIPIIAKVGEAVMNKDWVDQAGGESAINAMNRGGFGGGEMHEHYHIHTNAMFAKSAREIIDEMSAKNYSERKGKMSTIMRGDSFPGLKPRRK